MQNLANVELTFKHFFKLLMVQVLAGNLNSSSTDLFQRPLQTSKTLKAATEIN